MCTCACRTGITMLCRVSLYLMYNLLRLCNCTGRVVIGAAAFHQFINHLIHNRASISGLDIRCLESGPDIEPRFQNRAPTSRPDRLHLARYRGPTLRPPWWPHVHPCVIQCVTPVSEPVYWTSRWDCSTSAAGNFEPRFRNRAPKLSPDFKIEHPRS